MVARRAKAKILVDIELPDPEALSRPLVALMAPLEVVLVGWYAVPEQTSPEQAHDQFSDEARAALDEAAVAFRKAGAEVQTHLVFTGNELATIERISTEQDCDAILIPHPVERLEHLLVPLRGPQNAARIARFVSDLVQDGATDVTLLHVLEEGEEEHDVQRVLGRISDMMAEAGIQGSLIRLRIEVADDPSTAIIEAAQDYDAVVIGETEPSVREIIFGTVPERIVQKAAVPVMVVRHQSEQEGSVEE